MSEDSTIPPAAAAVRWLSYKLEQQRHQQYTNNQQH
jgi:hypothetical protein